LRSPFGRCSRVAVSTSPDTPPQRNLGHAVFSPGQQSILPSENPASNDAVANMKEPFNILLSSAGRRVGLLRLFQAALAELDIRGKLVATDVSPLAAAWQQADIRHLVPRCDAPEYIDCLLQICRREHVRVVVPTIDTELAVLSRYRAQLAAENIEALVSQPECVAIAADKIRTNAWLVANNFPTVRQTTVAGVAASPGDWQIPLIAKPRNGSSSVGLLRVDDRRALEHVSDPDSYVVETVAAGQEYTVDVLVNRQGRAVCAVPRRRIEIRGGEISKGVTVRARDIEALACAICERLPGAYGALNVQLFKAEDGSLSVVEINARFGGGFPLSAQAGADYPRWIIEELCGAPSPPRHDAWRHGVGMLRYDSEVFFDIASVSA
jgi:carbamoyl-phosphate synthase large subunit